MHFAVTEDSEEVSDQLLSMYKQLKANSEQKTSEVKVSPVSVSKLLRKKQTSAHIHLLTIPSLHLLTTCLLGKFKAPSLSPEALIKSFEMRKQVVPIIPKRVPRNKARRSNSVMKGPLS